MGDEILLFQNEDGEFEQGGVMSEWIGIENTWCYPIGYKWQCNGAMFIKDESGEFVFNEKYRQRLVKVDERAVIK